MIGLRRKRTAMKTIHNLNLLLLCLGLIFTTSNCKKDDNTDDSECTPAATNQVDRTHLPFGGPLVLRRDRGDTGPQLKHLWLCGLPTSGAGNSDASDWTNSDGTWDYERKPIVDGNVTWISDFTITLDGMGNRIITGNALPDHPTGVFPIDPSSVAYQYDRNPNIIDTHNVRYVFPVNPQVATSASCVTFGPSGIALTGSAIYHGASTLGNDAAAHEMLDRFGGHTDGTERYHYHYMADDLQDHVHAHTSGHSGLMGYMMDGFGIFGPYGETGELLTSDDLDECHGHTHPVMWDGAMVNIYHYHWTYDFPYTIGCFKGTKLY